MPTRLPSLVLALAAAAVLAACDQDSGKVSDDPLGTFYATVNGQTFEPLISGALLFEADASPTLFVSGSTCADPAGGCEVDHQLLLMVGSFSGKGRYAFDERGENEGAYSVVQRDTFRTYASANTGEIVITHYVKDTSVAGTFVFSDTNANCGGFAATCTATVTNGRFNLPITYRARTKRVFARPCCASSHAASKRLASRFLRT